MNDRWKRRDFLKLGTAGLALSPALSDRANARSDTNKTAARSDSPEFVDVHVYLGRWPFRRLRGDTSRALAEMLREQGVTQAWAGSFEGVFSKDVSAVNRWLFEDCREFGDGIFVPFGTVNPMLPDWQEDLRRCDEEYGMPGIRLHPAYHGYSFEAPEFERLLRIAGERDLIVQIVPWMEDKRHQHPLMPIPGVDLSPLTKLVDQVSCPWIVLSNGFRTPSGEALGTILASSRVYCDFSLLDIIDGLSELVEKMPVERILFGSYSPMFYFDSARLKMRESPLTEGEFKMISHATASNLLTTNGEEASR